MKHETILSMCTNEEEIIAADSDLHKHMYSLYTY